MPTADIAALPVGELALPDCWLWLWATYPMLDDARYVLGAWGFRYVTGGTWTKVGRSGKLAMGTGKILRCAAEPYLIGRRGAPRVHSKGVRNAILAPRREHSRKPDEAYRNAERAFGPARRADLFSRETRPGWEAFGDQAGAFDQAVRLAA